MTTYAHPDKPQIPSRKRCKVCHSPKAPARCKLARGHEGDCRFGSWSDGNRLYANLDLPLPKPVGRRSADPEDARP